MARIRSIKPELWTDPEFIELSLSARLLFIASWNFASDYGVLPDKPKQLRMQCLPGDMVDVDALIDELVSAQFVLREVAPNGDKVLLIRTFTKNQKINRATLGRWGDPAKWPKPPPPDNPQREGSVSATPRMGWDGSDYSDDTDSAVCAERESSPVDDESNECSETGGERIDRSRRLELLTSNGAPQRLLERPHFESEPA
jgi:hypothetical protein